MVIAANVLTLCALTLCDLAARLRAVAGRLPDPFGSLQVIKVSRKIDGRFRARHRLPD
jgi:hypothetical protein